jgi:hypothetical protein
MHHEEFMGVLTRSVAAHDPGLDRQPGQHYIVLPPEANQLVSCGVGLRSHDHWAYVLREHRGQVGAYLRRFLAADTTTVACVVYTNAAYLLDPDCDEEERLRITSEAKSHVLVAVLASCGQNSPLSPYRLVHNLAGGNLEAQQYTAEEIRAKCRESLEFHNQWVEVAD